MSATMTADDKKNLNYTSKQSHVKITHFTIVWLKQHHSFCNPQLTQFTQATLPKNLLYKFSSKHVFGWCQKKHFHCTIPRPPGTAFSKQLENKSLYIPAYLRKKMFVLEA